MAASNLYIFVLTAHNTNHFINDLINNEYYNIIARRPRDTRLQFIRLKYLSLSMDIYQPNMYKYYDRL